MLELKNVSKKFGKINTISNVDLQASKPGLYILTGENGSGKSTIIKLISKIMQRFWVIIQVKELYFITSL